MYFVVAIITFPFVALILLQGLKAADRRLDEMSDVYRFPVMTHVRHVAGPHLGAGGLLDADIAEVVKAGYLPD